MSKADAMKFISRFAKQEIIEVVFSCIPIEMLEEIPLSIYQLKSGRLLAELDELTEELKTAEETGKFLNLMKKLKRKNKEIDTLYDAYRRLLEKKDE